MNNVLSIILGGGRGGRLYPLTKYRSKPAVPFAGKYRLIDIPLSNCLNSGFNMIYVLTQFLSESLNKHVSRAYRLDPFSHGFVEIIAAEQSMEKTDWFQGTADAVRRSLRHFTDPRFEYFLILSGDQLYAIDLRDILKAHIRKGADITVACKPVPSAEATQLGVMRTDAEDIITQFFEKPPADKLRKISTGKGGTPSVLASMGIYVFNKDILFNLLTTNPKTDFGKGIIPDAIREHRVLAYRFDGYWVDIGTVKAYYEASLALAQARSPIDFYNEAWPFFTRSRYLPVTRVTESHLENALVADGSSLEKTVIRDSLVGLRSVLRPGTELQSSIIMGNDYFEDPAAEKKKRRAGVPDFGIGKNCLIRQAIIDKNVRMGDGVKIVNPHKKKNFEGPNYMIVDGITVVEKNAVIPPGSVL